MPRTCPKAGANDGIIQLVMFVHMWLTIGFRPVEMYLSLAVSLTGLWHGMARHGTVSWHGMVTWHGAMPRPCSEHSILARAGIPKQLATCFLIGWFQYRQAKIESGDSLHWCWS